ncbi:hypothetical protein AB0284_04050 [Pseudarthrobacter phenanthrenivorans]|uniref:hypothetical protein n=1 Tax=Pseudarthrobacter phenanthrenivorans TaxID=361575 RepID=UPI00344CADEC
MTLEFELTEAPATAATHHSRGGTYVTLPPGSEVPPQPEGSYVTLPAGPDVPPQPKGSYVSLPGAVSGHGIRPQGTYVTLPAAGGGGDRDQPRPAA